MENIRKYSQKFKDEAIRVKVDIQYQKLARCSEY